MGNPAIAQSARGVEREEGAESLRDTAGGGVAAAKDTGRGASWAHAVVWGTARVVAVDVERRGPQGEAWVQLAPGADPVDGAACVWSLVMVTHQCHCHHHLWLFFSCEHVVTSCQLASALERPGAACRTRPVCPVGCRGARGMQQALQ